MDNNEPELTDGAKVTAAIAKELDLALTEAGITNRRLSENSGINYQSIGRYIRGEREIGTATFLNICRHIPVDPALIWERAEKRLSGDTPKPD